MASVEEQLRTVLVADAGVSALVGTAIYPNRLPPHDSPTPWVYYTIPEELPGPVLGSNHTHRITVEFDLFAETYAECRALKLAIKAALDGYRGGLVRRLLWAGSESVGVEGGHNITVRFAGLVDDEATLILTEEGEPLLTEYGEYLFVE